MTNNTRLKGNYTQKQYLFPTVIEAASHFGLHKCTVDRISRYEPTNTGLRFMKP